MRRGFRLICRVKEGRLTDQTNRHPEAPGARGGGILDSNVLLPPHAIRGKAAFLFELGSRDIRTRPERLCGGRSQRNLAVKFPESLGETLIQD
jgi:hypothetical protein